LLRFLDQMTFLGIGPLRRLRAAIGIAGGEIAPPARNCASDLNKYLSSRCGEMTKMYSAAATAH